MSKDATVPYMRLSFQSFGILEHEGLDIIPGVSWFPIMNTLLTSNTHCSNKTFPFWIVSPLKILNLGVSPTIGRETLEKDIPYSGYGTGLNGCTFPSSKDVTSSLPNYLNCSAMDICLGVAISHITVTL